MGIEERSDKARSSDLVKAGSGRTTTDSTSKGKESRLDPSRVDSTPTSRKGQGGAQPSKETPHGARPSGSSPVDRVDLLDETPTKEGSGREGDLSEDEVNARRGRV